MREGKTGSMTILPKLGKGVRRRINSRAVEDQCIRGGGKGAERFIAGSNFFEKSSRMRQFGCTVQGR